MTSFVLMNLRTLREQILTILSIALIFSSFISFRTSAIEFVTSILMAFATAFRNNIRLQKEAELSGSASQTDGRYIPGKDWLSVGCYVGLSTTV